MVRRRGMPPACSYQFRPNPTYQHPDPVSRRNRLPHPAGGGQWRSDYQEIGGHAPSPPAIPAPVPSWRLTHRAREQGTLSL